MAKKTSSKAEQKPDSGSSSKPGIKNRVITRKTIALADLVPFGNNPRVHNETQMIELRKSLEMFGQYRDIVVDDKMTVLAGHGITDAMKSLGWKKASCCVIEGLTKKEKIKLVLADNKTQQLGGDDYDMIERLIREIADYDIPGYDPKGLEHLFAAASDAQKISESFSGLGSNIESGTSALIDSVPASPGATPASSYQSLDQSGSGASVAVYMSSDQYATIRRAIDAIRKGEGQPDLKEGRALELICAEYLS